MTQDDVVSTEQAAQMLEVSPDRIAVMVQEGLLDPVDDSEPATFSAQQVRALHDLGG